ncbi:hypothetical protein AGMMS50256_09300 [Betaproteobacteria bacterium]|nr:hypothetical protein AGMMS50256_09300 [Betaproteobacteria bacterium]
MADLACHEYRDMLYYRRHVNRDIDLIWKKVAHECIGSRRTELRALDSLKQEKRRLCSATQQKCIDKSI